MATITKASKEPMKKSAKVNSLEDKIERTVTEKPKKTSKIIQDSLPVPAPQKAVSKSKVKSSSVVTEPITDEVTKPAEKKAAKKVVEEPSTITKEPIAPAVLSHDVKWHEIKLVLEKLKEDTLREIRKSVKNGTEAVAAIEPGGDIYDQASSERDRELGLLLGDREREKIHSIDEALMRIDEGDYGICEECDEDIPLGRLKAMPFTRHCVKCKSDLEKLQAQTKRVEEERAYREIPIGSEDEES